MTTERRNQKARTRQALLQAARDLLTEGQPVTVIAAAKKSGISKATAYRYFSDPGVLAAEAGLDIEVQPYDTVVDGCKSVREKLRAVSLYNLDLALEHESKFRRYVGLTLASWADTKNSGEMRRGGRRLAMFQAAMEDVGTELDEKDRQTMIQALATATGPEAMIALLDVAGTDRETARYVVGEIAEALIDRYLGTAGASA